MKREADPRIVFLTGNARRHRWVAAQLAKHANLGAVLCEEKRPSVAPNLNPSSEDAAVIADHFAERDRVETALLGETSIPVEIEVRHVAHGAANDEQTLAWLRSYEPEFIVLLGTSVIGPALLDAFRDRVINLHLGLSPYYRGGATNFWPLYHGEPECVGATLHLATSTIDGGPILNQVRPRPHAEDRAHELGTRALIAGVATLPSTLAAFAAGRLEPIAQLGGGGRVCRRRDFDAEAVRKVRRLVDEGLIRDYAADFDARCRKFPIRQLPASLEHLEHVMPTTS